MKTSMILAAAAGAILGTASPVQVEERVAKTVYDVEWVTQIVTDEVVATATATVFKGPGNHMSFFAPRPQPTTSTVTVAAPAPSSISSSVSVVMHTEIVSLSPSVQQQQAVEAVATSLIKSPASITTKIALQTGTDFASTALYNHNIHRVNNSAPAVTYSDNYAASASILAATCNFHHNVTINGGGYGQNIAMWAQSGNAESLGASNAIAMASSLMWYNGEIDFFPSSDYDRANPDFSNFEAWGHYSQLVWKSTKEIGCAAQYCQPGTMESDMGAWFMVCNYFPAGNMGGEYGDNIGRPLGEATYVPPNMP